MKTNKWKLSLLIWSAMFPFSTAVTYGLAQLPFIAHWPIPARTFCLTCLLVPYMVFVALPFLNRRFQKWLQMELRETVTQSEPALADQSAEIRSENGRGETREQYTRIMTNGTESDQTLAPFQMGRMAS